MNSNYSVQTIDDNLKSQYPTIMCRRVLGKLGNSLFENSDFEKSMPDKLRYIAASSLETCVIGSYLLQCNDFSQLIRVTTAFFLNSERLANPCLCLSFWDPRYKYDQAKLYSLLLYNEFQYPIGIFDHKSRVFTIYCPQDQGGYQLFEQEYGRQFVHELIDLEANTNLLEVVTLGQIKHTLAIGFNKSFGHANWNDIQGLLNWRTLLINNIKFKEINNILVGPLPWLDPKLLFPDIRSSLFTSTEDCSVHTIINRCLIHMPIGFRINAAYERFWRTEVTSAMSKELKISLSYFKQKYWPIILINPRDSEWWRKQWMNQAKQIHEILQILENDYPNIGFILDGLTSFYNRIDKRKPSVRDESIRQIIATRDNVLLVSDESIANKSASYQIVDYCISQFGSGQALPAFVYSIPSITISAEDSIISEYSNPDTITHSCKNELRDTSRYEHFLPLRYLDICNEGYNLVNPQAYNYILNHMRMNLSPVI